MIPWAEPVPGEDGHVAVARPAFRARPPLTFVFPGSGVNVAVAHGLGRVPEGWIAVGLSAPISVYSGSAPSSDEVLVLRASGAGTALILPL